MSCFTVFRSIRNSSNHGFTLIELVIVIAIVAVLVSITVPAYSGYKIRAKVSECINNTAPAKFAVSEYRLTYGVWPPSLEATGQEQTGASRYCNMISNYDSSTGTITVDVNEPAVDNKLINVSPQLVPTLTFSHSIDWNCTAGGTDLDEIAFLPPSCRDN